MRFRARVEPPQPMHGLEIPPGVVDKLGRDKRPPVTITINGHSWRSRVAIMRGRYLLGLSNANRQAAGVVTGDEVDVEVELDTAPRVVVEPPDFARVLDADPAARTAYDRLAYGRKLQYVRSIESAKKPETRKRRIETAVATLRDEGSGPAARAKDALITVWVGAPHTQGVTGQGLDDPLLPPLPLADQVAAVDTVPLGLIDKANDERLHFGVRPSERPKQADKRPMGSDARTAL